MEQRTLSHAQGFLPAKVTSPLTAYVKCTNKVVNLQKDTKQKRLLQN